MTFCANCGAEVSGRFCQKCGAAVAGPSPGPTPGANPNPDPNAGYVPPAQQLPPASATPASAPMTDNLAGALCYLFGFITGILFLVLAPYNQNRTIRFHAFQSIFLSIAWVVVWIVVRIISAAFFGIPFLGLFVSLVLSFVVGIGFLIVWLYMMFKTYNGEKIVLPLIGPVAEKQAGV